jgi:DNA polymerase (family 10)
LPVQNSEIAKILGEVADLLAVEGANQFRVRAYRKAARTIATLSRNVHEMVDQGEDLSRLAGVGRDLAGKIEEIARTGRLQQLEELRRQGGRELGEVLKVGGLGPKRARQLRDRLGVRNLEDLERAARQGEVRRLSGFGAKTEQKILRGLDAARRAGSRTLYSEAREVMEGMLSHLRGVEGLQRAAAAGSYRRRRDTVGDLDILVVCQESSRAMEVFAAYEDVAEVLSQGATKSSVVLRSGLQVDLRVVEPASWGAALVYFTGSKDHSVKLRNRALQRELKLNEYGVWAGDQRRAGASEREVYAALGLPMIPPELREDRGEVEAAAAGRLPRLVELGDLRGDLHTHTDRTDGRDSLEEMARAAAERGLEYLAVTDHSQRVTMAKGLDAAGLDEQRAAVERVQKEVPGLRLLKGVEVDILEDGSLDLPDEALRDLDVVVAAAHYHNDLPRDRQTERLIRAMDNPLVNILAHPTGRLLGKRPAYQVDLERLIAAAAERRCILELDSQPDRLDLNDLHLKAAKEAGARVAINTDAHSGRELGFAAYGVNQARRGWLEAGDVVNTRRLNHLRPMLKR